MISFHICFSQQRDTTASVQEKALRVFIDCQECDINYIRTEIAFVNYVRDPNQSQVHLLVTTQETGSGGREFTLTFLGQNQWTGKHDTLTFATKQSDTDERVRSRLVQYMKLGLMRYVVKTPFADQIAVQYTSGVKSAEAKDAWNYWVFRVNANTFMNGEQSTSYTNFSGGISANRTTEEWKLRLNLFSDYSQNRFTLDTGDIISISRYREFSGLLVKSLGQRWSVGGYASARSSTYDNTLFSYNIAPALEYDLFPYSESTRQQLRFLYSVGVTGVEYEEETLFDKSSERLVNHRLSVALSLKQPWGSISTTLEGSQYLHDLRKNRLQLYGDLSIRIVEGLSLTIYGQISSVHDQLSLPKGGATTEEILLRRKQLASSYNYFGSVGLSYTFGSIYNNIVNPRFGN
jgi:hypothetical protein